MQVEILRDYTDVQLRRRVRTGEILEVSDSRAEELINNPHNIARLCEDMELRPKEKETQDLTPPLKTEETFKEPVESKSESKPKSKRTGRKKKL